MLHTFYRQELFDLVWSEPTRTIARRVGISDVGLAKACRRADLLLPPRVYWAKLAAGKTVKKPQLPRRGPGMSNRIVLGRDRWSAAWRTQPPGRWLSASPRRSSSAGCSTPTSFVGSLRADAGGYHGWAVIHATTSLIVGS